MHGDFAPLVGLLFDKDGTLVDFDATWGSATWAVARRLAAGDEAVATVIARAVGLDIANARLAPTSPIVASSTADYADLFARPIGAVADEAFMRRLDELYTEITETTLTPIGDPAGVLRRLAEAGYSLGMATNDSQAGAHAHAARLGVAPHLGFVAGYDSGHGSKPGPGMVNAFAAHLGVAPAAVAIIGDSVHDLEAGRAAGARRIAVLTGHADRATLGPHADIVLNSIADLPDLLEGMRGRARS